MQTGHILFFFMFPIVLEGCCGRNQKKVSAGLTGLQQDVTHQHYRAVEGESFMMPCIKSGDGYIKVLWSRTGNVGPSFSCGRVLFVAEAKHTGKYKCLTSGGERFLHLEVVEKSRMGCFQPEQSDIELYIGTSGEIPCPAHNCTNNSDVAWYTGNISVSELSRETCVENGHFHLCEVKGKVDEDVYFCDRKVIERGVTWTFRRAVNVKVLPNKTTPKPPDIIYPDANRTEKVELDQYHRLTCDVCFQYEKNISAKVQWYLNHGGNTKQRTLLDMESPLHTQPILQEYCIRQSHIIKTVTSQHLNHTYTCFASNTAGNVSVTIKLEERVKWPSRVGYPIAFLLLAAGMAIILHMKSLELQIMYRSHFHFGNHGEKPFDVLLSHVWSATSAEMETGWTLSSPSGPETDKEACQQCMDLTNTELGEANRRPRVMLLHQVLEEQWGYRLCLLDRDIVPGGAYANDVVCAIQRSQMLICLLSADYLCNSNALFVLESGIQALLQKSTPKLLLIWTCRDSATLIQEAPLPSLVQRALKVLPSLNWATGKPTRASCDFWRSLKKAMPNHRVKLESIL
ncbi:interleukin-18 receptor accessory protein-like [Solea senegalensis]|uniref:Interleukin-18 receptor accessory protein-like n=1 Tax=Solea senegalensis TaxID=28829 RepID=A0AAV6Q305_SOLSE|nr:interleukin-18 receptor accessory protein-like isoform X1 [Solea senegalensis]KAG7482751.1 interleukin-18 receptor accessory protein-like [Solea senegalensis]